MTDILLMITKNRRMSEVCRIYIVERGDLVWLACVRVCGVLFVCDK